VTSMKQAIALLISLIVSNPTVGEPLADLRRRFINEAPSAWNKYIDLASHTCGEVSTMSADLAVDKTLSNEGQIEFKVNGLMGIRVRTSDSSQVLDGENDRYNFVLKATSGDGWTLRSFAWKKISDKHKIDVRGSVTDERSDTFGSSASRQAIAYACQGLLLQATWLPAMFVAPSFKIIALTQWGDQGSDLVRLDFEYVPANTRNNPVRNGHVVLDPARFWLIKESEVAGYEPEPECRFRIQTENEFDDSIEGFPYAARHVLKTLDIPGHESENIYTTKLRKMDESDVQPFSLSAFGVAEPPPESSATRWIP
jgi:hypothetical protein